MYLKDEIGFKQMSYRSYRAKEAILGMAGFATAILACFVVKFLTSPLGQFLIGCSVVFAVIFIIVRLFCMDIIYEKFSTKLAQKRFVVNNTTLRNNICTVLLTPKQKIVVMENNYGVDDTKKMFTISKDDTQINKTWSLICSTFDDFSSIESLTTYFNIKMININLVTYDVKPQKKKEEKKINIPEQQPAPEPQPQNSIPEPPEENDCRIVDF